MPFSSPITPAASATVTASGSGAAVDLGVATTAILSLVVTAATGTLDVAVETSGDGSTWTALGAFAQANAPSQQRDVRFPSASRYLRVRWTLGGTSPSFTFSVAGQALIVYATPADLDALAIQPKALAQFTASDKDKALCGATSDIDDALVSGRYVLPLVAWPDSVRQRCSDIAAFRLLRNRGFNPEAGSDQLIVKAYDDAQSWIDRVAREMRTLSGVVDSKPTEYSGGAVVYSAPKRGWPSR